MRQSRLMIFSTANIFEMKNIYKLGKKYFPNPYIIKTSLKIFKHYKLKPSLSIIKEEKAKDKVGVGVELVSKELNHLAAILHVYAGGLNFMK